MSNKSIVAAVAAVVFMFFGSCNDSPTQQTNEKVYGIFTLFIDQVMNTTQFTGKMYNGPIPDPVWDTLMTVGECKLIVPKQTTCQGCEGVCVDNNNCQPEPDTITVGELTITGMINRGGTTTSTVTATNAIYMPKLDNRPKNPPCEEGGTITLAASGNDAVAGFTISAKTISKIEISSDSIAMNPGEPILLKWKSAANPDNSRLKVIIDISYHGGTKGKIECDCRDDGELEIPAVLLDSLKTFGMSGYPRMEIYRQSYATAPGTGAQLVVQAFVQLWLKIPGLITCSADSQCPDGQECAADKRCREVK
ncbi:MAG TPA: hypothetical protein VHO70_07955 [Chitinispirillaceae bacterium]|nr:hypothetical protein [Chitinispirillaceae bacterium]